MNLKKEKCKVISLASRVKSNLRLNLSNQILINNDDALACPYIHLYVVSNEQINEDDWCMCDDRMSIYEDPIYFVGKCKSIENGWINVIDGQGENPDWTSKIIASTDKNLNLPEPSPQFVEKFVEEYNKGNIITDVNVDFIFNTTNEDWSKRPVQLDGFYSPKVDKNNFITITKIKESWNKDEIKELFNKFRKDFPLHRGIQIMDNDLDTWINENL